MSGVKAYRGGEAGLPRDSDGALHLFYNTNGGGDVNGELIHPMDSDEDSGDSHSASEDEVDDDAMSNETSWISWFLGHKSHR